MHHKWLKHWECSSGSSSVKMMLVGFFLQLDVLFGNLGEMVEFQVEFLRTLEDGIRLVPNLERLERVEQFKVRDGRSLVLHASLLTSSWCCWLEFAFTWMDPHLWLMVVLQSVQKCVCSNFFWPGSAVQMMNLTAFAFPSLLNGLNMTDICLFA